MVLIVDDLLIGSFRFVLSKLADAVDAELTDDKVYREELLAAQMRLELGEITEEEFAAIERDMLSSPDPAQRTLRYCATFNNGVGSDGAPDVDVVTRASRVAPNTLIGRCNPVACVAGQIAAPCASDTDCDSKPEAGDGWCDACQITGGQATENEQFVLWGFQFVEPTPIP